MTPKQIVDKIIADKIKVTESGTENNRSLFALFEAKHGIFKLMCAFNQGKYHLKGGYLVNANNDDMDWYNSLPLSSRAKLRVKDGFSIIVDKEIYEDLAGISLTEYEQEIPGLEL